MKVNPINNNQTSFQSQFKPTNSLRATLRVGQENGNKTLLNSMRKLMNDGEKRLIDINSYFYRDLLDEIFDKKYGGTVIDIYGTEKTTLFEHTEPEKYLDERGRIETEEIEYSIARDVATLLRTLADIDNVSKDKEIVNMSKKDVIKNLKAVEEKIFG